ncbi:hypothetical protein [Salinispora cortesiana]|uniref:hypothetical protein n=1 Tax=Salinispora cortesiana TaxID=1305843 RepID=UPI0016600329|nr:hypothetical protein [Salinispora cortesiana]
MTSDRAEYEHIRTLVDSVFALDLRLPNMVFRKPGPNTIFTDFQVALSDEFWPATQALARTHGDESAHKAAGSFLLALMTG